MESAPLVDCAGGAGRRRPCPGITAADRLATKGSGIHRTRRRSRRSSPSCAPPAMTPMESRLRGVIVVLWRAGLRVSEALALAESDLDRVRGAIQVRHGKGGRRREVGMDRWAWEAARSLAQLFVRACRSARCSACCAARLADGRAQQPGSVFSCATPRSRPGCVGGWPRISSGMLTLSRCRARVCRWSSSSGSSGMPTSGSRPCTCVASITPRSCTPSTSAQRR